MHWLVKKLLMHNTNKWVDNCEFSVQCRKLTNDNTYELSGNKHTIIIYFWGCWSWLHGSKYGKPSVYYMIRCVCSLLKWKQQASLDTVLWCDRMITYFCMHCWMLLWAEMISDVLARSCNWKSNVLHMRFL